MKLFNKSKKEEHKISYETNKIVEQFMNKENSLENKFDVLNNTTDIGLFFETIKSINNVDKISLEHDLIDRCFKNINFTKEENLKELYIKLKLYKNEMCKETIEYASKLFEYCKKNYIDK